MFRESLVILFSDYLDVLQKETEGLKNYYKLFEYSYPQKVIDSIPIEEELLLY